MWEKEPMAVDHLLCSRDYASFFIYSIKLNINDNSCDMGV